MLLLLLTQLLNSLAFAMLLFLLALGLSLIFGVARVVNLAYLELLTPGSRRACASSPRSRAFR